jgi:D-methionine transport system permease protein
MSNPLYLQFLSASWETIYMVLVSGIVSCLIGLPLGIILSVTQANSLLPNPLLHKMLNAIVNIGRSIPFIILLVALIPITRFIIGTSIGTHAALIPLIIGAIPFVARIVQNALAELPHGLIESGRAMGASPLQIIYKIMLPETKVALINGFTITFISLVGYSAMAGAMGGGGLGDLAIRYGYQRFDTVVMLYTIVLLVIFVQMLQYTGDALASRLSRPT